MKTILVTGHKGFIGSHLTKALRDLGMQVIGRDLKEGENILNCRLPLEIDWCFHLAAQTNARFHDARLDADINIIGTLRILDYYGARVVFASSSAVNYPCTPYAISKRAAEEYVRLAGGRVVRLCNIHGPGGHGVFQKFEEQETLQIAGNGEQTRTYAIVSEAVAALIEAPEVCKPGDVDILLGSDMTVNQVADKFFPDKPRKYIERAATDIMDGRQIRCL